MSPCPTYALKTVSECRKSMPIAAKLLEDPHSQPWATHSDPLRTKSVRSQASQLLQLRILQGCTMLQSQSWQLVFDFELKLFGAFLATQHSVPALDSCNLIAKIQVFGSFVLKHLPRCVAFLKMILAWLSRQCPYFLFPKATPTSIWYGDSRQSTIVSRVFQTEGLLWLLLIQL